jgi:hypothetical protein
MLLEKFDSLGLDALIPLDSFKPIPRYGDPEWRNIDAAERGAIVKRANEIKGIGAPRLPCSLYLETARSGDRAKYETPYFARREMLLAGALGVCAQGADGDAADAVIDLIWAICEESTWVVPAHNSRWTRGGKPYAPLFDARAGEYVDLFAAETASVLAWTCYLLREVLDDVTPLIVIRAREEIRRRVLAPYLEREDFWWMGYMKGEQVINWNPWINSNAAAAALLIEDDVERRLGIVRKSCRSIDIFVDAYADDGGCEEGPTYFDHAGGTLLDALQMLDAATGGKFNIYNETKIKNIPDYIRQMNIAGSYFTNFADANARLSPAAKLLLRAARDTGNAKLAAFAASRINGGVNASSDEPEKAYHVYRILQDIFTKAESAAEMPYAPDASHYYEGTQVCIMRSARLTAAAKGGHNNEGHSHNDVGNYIIYADGKPAVIDVGVETYTLNTFNDKRYTLWAMQSGYHNTAIVNGTDQKDGGQYRAKDTSFDDDGTVSSFKLDIAGAYPPEAKLVLYKRTVALLRGEEKIRVHDEIVLDDCAERFALPIMCGEKPALELGKVWIGNLLLKYPSAAFDASSEEIPIPDARLQKGWARPALYRVLLQAKRREKVYNINLVYSLERRGI